MTAVEIAVEEARALGIRVTISRGSMNLSRKDGGLPPDEVVQDEDTILADCERVLGLFHDPKPGSMVQIALAPCSPFSVTTSLMAASAELATRLDAPLHTVRLGLLAHDERVEVLPARRRRVQQGRRDRVRAERQAADRVDLRGAEADLLEHVEHEVPDERRGAVVQRDAAQVDVVVGLAARRQRDLPVHDREVLDEGEQLLAGRRREVVGHGPQG